MDKSKLPKMMKKAWDVILPGGYRGRKRPKKKTTKEHNKSRYQQMKEINDG